MPRKAEPIRRHTRQRGIFTQQLLLHSSLTPSHSTNQLLLLLNPTISMAPPHGLVNSRNFVTYNHDEVTQAERQPLETRSDGLGVYLTPQQVGAVVLFLVENLTAPVDRRIGQSCR